MKTFIIVLSVLTLCFMALEVIAKPSVCPVCKLELKECKCGAPVCVNGVCPVCKENCQNCKCAKKCVCGPNCDCPNCKGGVCKCGPNCPCKKNGGVCKCGSNCKCKKGRGDSFVKRYLRRTIGRG